MPERFDAAVVGGGPAGATVALCLARRGWKVCLFETTAFDGERYGETLPPEINPLLRELGVFDEFRALAPLESPGMVSVWGGPPPGTGLPAQSARAGLARGPQPVRRHAVPAGRGRRCRVLRALPRGCERKRRRVVARGRNPRARPGGRRRAQRTAHRAGRRTRDRRPPAGDRLAPDPPAWRAARSAHLRGKCAGRMVVLRPPAAGRDHRDVLHRLRRVHAPGRRAGRATPPCPPDPQPPARRRSR